MMQPNQNQQNIVQKMAQGGLNAFNVGNTNPQSLGTRGASRPNPNYNPAVGNQSMQVGPMMQGIGNFLKNPANVPQDPQGNYKYTRTNRSGPGGTNPAY